jgi:hypothetical protein
VVYIFYVEGVEDKELWKTIVRGDDVDRIVLNVLGCFKSFALVFIHILVCQLYAHQGPYGTDFNSKYK